MPWVPSAVLAELIETQRAFRALVASPAALPDMTPVTQCVPAAAPAASAVAPLPRAVADACEAYAYGDPNERAANYRLARRLADEGVPILDIVRQIRTGAPLPAGVG